MEKLVCDLCNGKGIVKMAHRGDIHFFCPKCRGTKKVGWLENIFGKKEVLDESDHEAIQETHLSHELSVKEERTYNVITLQEWEFYV